MIKKILSVFIFVFFFLTFSSFVRAVDVPNFTGESQPTVGPLSTTNVKVNSGSSLGSTPDIIDSITGTSAQNNSVGSKASGFIPCGNSSSQADACTLCDFFVMFHGLMKWGMSLLFILAGVGIFISGIIYIISAGNSGMMTKAKGYLTMCIVGAVIVLCAWLIVNTTMWFLGAKRTGIWYNISC